MVIAVASEKGGVGKTTIAVQTAILRAQQGRDVLLVDADPQRSALEIAGVRAEERVEPSLTAVALTGKGLAEEVRKLKPKYDDVVIDVGGRDSAALRCGLVCADLVLVPVLPGQLDAWTLENFDSLVEQAQGFNPAMRAWLVVNKADTHPAIKIADEVAEFAQELENITVAKNRLGYRVAFRRCVADGRAVNETEKVDRKAVAEFTAMVEEVLSGAD